MDDGLSGINLIGKRVRLKSTNDPRSMLRFNDLGTIVGATNSSNWDARATNKLWIKWDKDGNYTLMDTFDSLDVFGEAGI